MYYLIWRAKRYIFIFVENIIISIQINIFILFKITFQPFLQLTQYTQYSSFIIFKYI